MKILGWIVALPFIALALFIVARFVMCRPDGEVVRVATPMVEKIADYIVKHGVPESLADIPDLPYGLEGCSRKEVYWTATRPKKIVDNKENADYVVIYEYCQLNIDSKKFLLSLRFTKSFRFSNVDHGKLDVKTGKTNVGVSFETDKNGKLIRKKIGTGFDNRFGFCRQFKQ
jgi:hypothetical protein